MKFKQMYVKIHATSENKSSTLTGFSYNPNYYPRLAYKIVKTCHRSSKYLYVCYYFIYLIKEKGNHEIIYSRKRSISLIQNIYRSMGWGAEEYIISNLNDRENGNKDE